MTSEHESELGALSCAEVGLPAGTSVEIWTVDGERLLLGLQGDIVELMRSVEGT